MTAITFVAIIIALMLAVAVSAASPAVMPRCSDSAPR
jgi:hypothetical protein